jgi:surfactin synthase thioesterase subunit
VTLVAARLAGREDRLREPPTVDFTDLVSGLADELTIDEPYAFFGHCFGALLALEVARERVRRGQPAPVRLVVAGAAPTDPRPVLAADQVVPELARTGALDEALLANPDVLALFKPAIIADFALSAAYRRDGALPLSMPIDAIYRADHADEDGPSARAWLRETSGPGETLPFAGPSLFPGPGWHALGDLVLSRAGGS